MKTLLSFFAAGLLMGTAHAQLPVSGRSVPGMVAFDTIMTNFMNANGITAGVLGISRAGRIEYLRSFGWLVAPAGGSPGIALPENAMMRSASVVKTVTAAAIRHLDAQNGFGATGLNRAAFIYPGSGTSGLLNVMALPSLGDARHANVTLSHLLLHQAGFDRSVDPPGDVMFKSREIATALAINTPPSNINTMGYMLGQRLEWTPGVIGSTTIAPNSGGLTSSSSASSAILTTAAAHGLVVGDVVTITGHSVASVNGAARVVSSVPSATTFTLQNVGSTGGTGGSWTETLMGTLTSSTAATPTLFTAAAAHGFAVGDPVRVTGHSDGAANTTALVASVPSATTFTLTGVGSNGGTGGTWSRSIDAYSNYGYMVLGEVLQSFAPGGYFGFVHSRIFSPLWVPSTEFVQARTFVADRHQREPRYMAFDTSTANVFDNTAPIQTVPAPDGGFAIEQMMAHGGTIASAQAMIHFANAYHLWYANDRIGRPITAADPMQAGGHSGRLDGTETLLQQRADGVVFYFALNRTDFGTPGYAGTLSMAITNQLNAPAGFTWPNTTADGFWVNVGTESPGAGYGGYHSTYQGFNSALVRVADDSRLRLKPGSQAWTGTITKRLQMDAPEGEVRIGP